MSSIFSKIISGEIPCYKVAEDEHNIAFLDIFPLKKGHTLVVPKLEIDQLFELPTENYTSLMNFSYKLASAIKSAFPCNRISLQVIGLEVPHAHVHLIPINSLNDCNFNNQKLKFTTEEFKSIAAQIAQNIKH
ncbi:MAG: HIT family protein [Bacteroidota bacterium]|jgi:histidine triad (HIT) family protein